MFQVASVRKIFAFPLFSSLFVRSLQGLRNNLKTKTVMEKNKMHGEEPSKEHNNLHHSHTSQGSCHTTPKEEECKDKTGCDKEQHPDREKMKDCRK